MPGLDRGIHVLPLAKQKTRMAGTSPAMTRENSPRGRGDLLNRIDVIFPAGKSPKSLSSPFAKNIPLPARPDSNLYPPPSCPTQRGVTRTSRTSGRDAVDVAAR